VKNNLSNGNTRKSIQALDKTYGISLNKMLKALWGKDEKYAKQLGENGKEAKFVKAIEPQLRDAVMSTIEATDLQNKLISDVVSKAVAGTKTNESQIAKMQLDEIKLQNYRLEKGFDYIQAIDSEGAKHSDEMKFLQTKWSVAEGIRAEDNRVRMAAKLAEPELKQLTADETARQNRYKHYLTHGDASRIDLLPQANYETTSIGGMLKKFVSFFFT
jgi:hypothetical protein